MEDNARDTGFPKSPRYSSDDYVKLDYTDVAGRVTFASDADNVDERQRSSREFSLLRTENADPIHAESVSKKPGVRQDTLGPVDQTSSAARGVSRSRRHSRVGVDWHDSDRMTVDATLPRAASGDKS